MWLAVCVITVGINFALFGYYCAMSVKYEKIRKG